MMYGYGYPQMGGGGFGFELIFMLILLVVIIWAVFAVVGSAAGKDARWHSHGGEDEALKILKARYAKGEIDKAEFEQKKTDLMSR